MSVTAPRGFRAAGITAGIKPSGTPDLALVVNDGPTTTAAGVFTTNKVKAAPVLWSQQVLAEPGAASLRAVVLNSGCANACTGPQGFQDTHATAERVGAALDIGAVDVAVCSTGLIGEPLPMSAVLSGVDTAAAALDTGAAAGLAAATAVMTTDTHPKQAAVSGDGWAVGGFAKGAGMCAPNMATMLAVVTTDAVLDPADAATALTESVATTFNALDVDGGTSTNDTVLLLASGASGVTVEAAEFRGRLTAVCADLVAQLQADAEGVTKHVRITVTGATDAAGARAVARTVAEDDLCSTAWFGADPNWGRVAMALGRADTAVDPDRLDITLNDVTVCRGGVGAEDRTKVDLSGTDITVHIGLNLGEGTATVLTTDLSHGYVEENSAYST